jgi:hypothetical protein
MAANARILRVPARPKSAKKNVSDRETGGGKLTRTKHSFRWSSLNGFLVFNPVAAPPHGSSMRACHGSTAGGATRDQARRDRRHSRSRPRAQGRAAPAGSFGWSRAPWNASERTNGTDKSPYGNRPAEPSRLNDEDRYPRKPAPSNHGLPMSRRYLECFNSDCWRDSVVGSHLSLYFRRGFLPGRRRLGVVVGGAPVGSTGGAWPSQVVMPSPSSGGLMK